MSLEVTHHGPSEVKEPLLYMEVGSDEAAWANMDACRAVIEAIVELSRGDPPTVKTAIGFGGPHYAPNFTEAVKGGEIAFNLNRLYEYMYRRLITANIKKDDAVMEEILNMLTEFREVWREVFKQHQMETAEPRQGKAQDGGGISFQG